MTEPLSQESKSFYLNRKGKCVLCGIALDFYETKFENPSTDEVMCLDCPKTHMLDRRLDLTMTGWCRYSDG